MLIHQDMLRRTKCALFFGLVASSPQRPLSTEQLCAVCLACLHVHSTVEFQMLLVLWNPVTIETIRKRALSSPGETEPRKRNEGHWVYVLYTRPLLKHFQRKPCRAFLIAPCRIVPRQIHTETFCYLRSVRRFVVVYERSKHLKLPMDTIPSL